MTTVVKYATESVAKLSGKKKKTRLKVRDKGQEKAKCLTKVQYNSRTCLNFLMNHQREKRVE